MTHSTTLAWKAFLILWGGWTVATIILTLVLPKFLFQSTSTDLGLGALILIGLFFLQWERRFRAKNLHPQARRSWHAGLVVIPLLLASPLPRYAHKVCDFVPGGRWATEEFVFTITRFDHQNEPTLNPTDLAAFHKLKEGLPLPIFGIHARNEVWGNRKLELSTWSLTSHSDPGKIWTSDWGSTQASSGSETIFLDASGIKEIVERVAPGSPEKLREELANHFLTALVDDAGIPAEGPCMNLVPQGRTTGTITLPWALVTAGFFSLLLLPVTWFVVRFTMFPKKDTPTASSE